MPFNLLLLSFAGLLTGLSQVINKKLATKGHKSTTYTTVIMLLNAAFAIPFLFYQFYISHSLYYWLLILISTTAFAFSTYFSFKAYKVTDVSIVSIIYRFNIVIVALIGIAFLKEQYSFQSYIGLLLIFFSSVVIALEKGLKFDSGIIYAFLMAITGAIATVLDKIILNDFSPYTYVFVNNLLVGSIFAFNKKTINDAKILIKQNTALLILASLLTIPSFAIVLVVLQKTNVSQTMPAYKGLSFITPVVLGIMLLNERKKLVQKIIGAIAGVIGISLLYL